MARVQNHTWSPSANRSVSPRRSLLTTRVPTPNWVTRSDEAPAGAVAGVSAARVGGGTGAGSGGAGACSADAGAVVTGAAAAAGGGSGGLWTGGGRFGVSRSVATRDGELS